MSTDISIDKEAEQMNIKIEEELDKQFPKGDPVRGKALVLVAISQIELDKESEEMQKAYGFMIEINNQLRADKKVLLDKICKCIEMYGYKDGTISTKMAIKIIRSFK